MLTRLYGLILEFEYLTGDFIIIILIPFFPDTHTLRRQKSK